jgi:hypothetical protein
MSFRESPFLTAKGAEQSRGRKVKTLIKCTLRPLYKISANSAVNGFQQPSFFIYISFSLQRYILPVLLFLSSGLSSAAISGVGDSAITFLPEKRIYPSVFLDPLECQMMGGSYLLSRKGTDLSLYSTVNMGFNRPVLAGAGKHLSWEFNFGVGTFSQFDLLKKEDGSYLAGLLNTDFKLSADYVVSIQNNLLRLRTFHISSHLGDDYLQRNSDTLVNDKSVNYEQADLTYMRMFEKGYIYGGAGIIYTKYVFRERFSLQTGGLLNFGRPGTVTFFASTDIKLIAENDFSPDVRTAFGININRKTVPLMRIWAEYYSGRLPYSTIDYGRVNWVGLGMTFNIFVGTV